MNPSTRTLWDLQERHPGDRKRLFTAVRQAIGGEAALYPGSFVDVAASFAYPAVTYVDIDKRTPRFFDDREGVGEIITAEGGRDDASFTFIHGDYTTPLQLDDESFDVLISLYAGLVSDHCTRYLKVGGHLLANPSHGDVALATTDDRYQLAAVVKAKTGGYSVDSGSLDEYLVPKKGPAPEADAIRVNQRGVGYTKSAFAYLFRRVS